MFEALGERLTGVFDRLTGRGVLSEKDIDEALREVRLALLDADVALPVVKDFIAKARESATGEAVLRAVKPSEQVVKIVHDGLVDMLGGDEAQPLNFAVAPPAVILMAGPEKETEPLVRAALEKGAHACLHKPFDPKEAAGLIEEIMRQKEAR